MKKKNKIIFLDKDTKNNLKLNSFKIEYQSNLTPKIIERILQNKNPGLPKIDLSLNLHKSFLIDY